MPTSTARCPYLEPLLRLPDVAKRLGVTPHTVRKLTYHEGLRWTKIGRELRFKREWVEEFIERVDRVIPLPTLVARLSRHEQQLIAA